MIAAVKRCPFCNGHNLVLDRTEHVSAVRCFDCQAKGPDTINGDEQAVEEWNEGGNQFALVADHTANRDDLRKVDLQ